MDRNSMNDRQAPAALSPQIRELTEVELDAVWGGCRKAGGQPPEYSTIGSATGGAGGGKAEAIIAI